MPLIQGRDNETVIPRHIALLNLEKQNIVKIVWTSAGSAGFWLGNGNLTVNSYSSLLAVGEIDMDIIYTVMKTFHLIGHPISGAKLFNKLQVL